MVLVQRQAEAALCGLALDDPVLSDPSWRGARGLDGRDGEGRGVQSEDRGVSFAAQGGVAEVPDNVDALVGQGGGVEVGRGKTSWG